MSSSRATLAKALVVAAFLCDSRSAAAEIHTVKVEMDYARIVRTPEGAQTLVIGNPALADITMLKNDGLMVVTGKSFGTTNLIMLDRAGQQVGEALITVAPAEDKLVVYRGSHRESLSCKPRCARAVDLADDSQYMNNTIDAARAHDSAVSSLRK